MSQLLSLFDCTFYTGSRTTNHSTQLHGANRMKIAKIFLFDASKVFGILGAISIVSFALVQFAPDLLRHIGGLLTSTF